MKVEAHLNRIVLRPDNEIEAELLDVWFKHEALTEAASYKAGGNCEGLTVTFKKEKSAPTTSQAALDEFKQLHHNPIVARLNAEIVKLESESIKETKEANELRERLRKAEWFIWYFTGADASVIYEKYNDEWLVAERKEESNAETKR